MSITAAIPALIVVGLIVLIRRAWIPRGPLAALAGIVALLAAIIALGLVVSPYLE